MTEQELRIAIGGYVLGALEPAEALEVQRHLPGCRDCQREYLELTEVLPALAALQRGLASQLADAVTPEAGPGTAGRRATPPPDDDLVLRRALRQVEAERRRPGSARQVRPARSARPPRRRRRFTGAAVAAALLAAAPIGTAVLLHNSPAHAPTEAVHDTASSVASVVTFTGTNAATTASVTVTLRPDGSGTQVDALLTGVRRGMVCHLVARLATGQRVNVGTPAKVRDAALSTRLAGRLAGPPDRVAAVDVVDGNGVMVTARR